MKYILILPLAYLLGSISWGLIIGKMRRGIDVRDHGSGATGVTNVLRTLGPRMAGLVLIADVSKGTVAVILARVFIDTSLGEAIAGILVIIGHSWPAFSRFQGGRGVTTGIGAMVVMSLPIAAIGVAIFLPTVLISRYVSLGSVFSVIGTMIVAFIMVWVGAEPWEYLIYVTIGGCVILWRHQGNIQRLINGTERRLWQKVNPSTRKATPPDRE
ncbi:glycerol-3-phosphate 1-O-acyltransferase PlsY [Dehalococcoidia bacterium]|nr:glycerol-3-phosphate 1-O-acyltransferase PlsY [Dehalococcoidia bacterium]